jgi:hypothetical protein
VQPSQRTKSALAGLSRAESRVAAARAELHAAIVADLAAGIRQADLVRLTGYSREHIRKIAEKAHDADAQSAG